MPWCFAIVNNKLAEIYFDDYTKRIKMIGHCYVKKQEYRTRQEQKWIKKDIAKYRFVYKQGKYKKI